MSDDAVHMLRESVRDMQVRSALKTWDIQPRFSRLNVQELVDAVRAALKTTKDAK